MKAQQPIFLSFIRPSELLFGVLMLIVIFMTSCNAANASPKVSLESTYIEKTLESSADQRTTEFQQKHAGLPIPVLVMLLLILSYTSLTGSLYLLRELKK